MLAFLTSGTFRRIIVFLLGLVFVALNKKFGLDLNAEEIGGIVVMTIAQLAQSSFKEAAVIKAEAAAATITDKDKAVEAIKAP